jgi:predicted  nucleic acid-binding Zn-ribbon protein
MNQHQCIKCKAVYRDNDTEAYLCEPCVSSKNAIAAKIDAEFSARPHVEPMSDLKQHEMNGHTINVNGRNVTFARG